MEFALIIWLISAVLCAVLASSKDASVGMAIVVGLLLGPIGILIVAFWGKDKPDAKFQGNTALRSAYEKDKELNFTGVRMGRRDT